MEQIAIIGSGLIGRAWTIVFARAGHRVRLWDCDPAALRSALTFVASTARELRDAGLSAESPGVVAARVEASTSLAGALAGASHAQESVTETIDAKRAIFADMDAVAPPGCTLASSTSTIPASAFSEGLAGRHRCLVAHPVNPPHLAPVVEIVPAPWTDAATATRTRALMAAVGQSPVLVRKEVPGFIMNRLQASLLREAWRLVGEGYCSVEDLDRCVRDGLGLRWAFMGPFETIDLNAPAGVADYAARYGQAWHDLLKDTQYEPWDESLIAQVTAERATLLPRGDLAARGAWRDRRLMALVAHLRSQP